MQYSLTQEQLAVQTAMRKFASEETDPISRAIDRNNEYQHHLKP